MTNNEKLNDLIERGKKLVNEQDQVKYNLWTEESLKFIQEVGLSVDFFWTFVSAKKDEQLKLLMQINLD